jgi:SAM-dependent methyltransferase
MDPFEAFAGRYDLGAPGDPLQDEPRLSFLRGLLERYSIHRVLDCSCGTGADLVRLHSLGAEVHGSDASEAMLERARARLEEAGLDLPLAQTDFRDLSAAFEDRFDAVLCLTTSLPQLLDEEEILRALRSMRSVLRPGAVLVLTQGLTDRQHRERLRYAPVAHGPDFTRVLVMDYAEQEWEVTAVDLLHPGDETEVHVARFRYRLLLADDYERLLAEAGFPEHELFGDWELGPYDRESSRRLIAVARA